MSLSPKVLRALSSEKALPCRPESSLIAATNASSVTASPPFHAEKDLVSCSSSSAVTVAVNDCLPCRVTVSVASELAEVVSSVALETMTRSPIAVGR
eukprot:6908708-Prymnesium_polylepis.1